MIELRIFDINGKELSNKDTIKYIEIIAEFQEHDHSGGLYREQIDTLISIETMLINPDQMYEKESYLCIPPFITYDANMLCHTFGLGSNRNDISDQEYKECIIDVICSKLGIESDEKKMFRILNNFEIISK